MPLSDEEFRQKFVPQPAQKGVCIDCKFLAAQKPKRRCTWCQIRKEGTDAEVASAMFRQNRDEADWTLVSEYRPKGWGYCTYCHSSVPEFMMVSGKRCHGCLLASQRDRDALKKYGLGPGERQKMFDAQGGSCLGCKKSQRVTGLSVHHSHLTGEAHFMSCLTCNKLVMGNAQDDPQTLLRLALGMLIPVHKPGGMEKFNKMIEDINNGV